MTSYVKRCCLGVAAVFMFLSLSGAAFSATLSGTVDSLGNPVAGATVRLLGTTTSVIANGSGQFSIGVPDDSAVILQASKSGSKNGYSTPYETGTGTIDSFDLSCITNADFTSLFTSMGLTQISGRGFLAIRMEVAGSGHMPPVYGATAVMKDYNGNNVFAMPGVSLRYIKGEGASAVNFVTAPGAETHGFIAVNVPPGAYLVSASKTGSSFAWKPVVIFADGMTDATMDYGCVIRSTTNITVSGQTVQLDSDNVVIGSVGVTLLLGSGLSDTSDGAGNYSISGVPLYSVGTLKMTKSGFVDTYQDQSFDNTPITTQNVKILSQAGATSIAALAGVTLNPLKGHLGANMDESGVVVTAVNKDGATLPGLHVYYFSASGGGIDPSLTSTSSNGTFLAFNLTPNTPFFVKATKGAAFLGTMVTQVFPGGLTWLGGGGGGGESGYSISGHVSLSGGTSSVTDVLLTLSGGGPTDTRHPDSYGNYEFAGLTADYTLTPSLSNYTFSPVLRTYVSFSGRQSDQNFTGTYTPPANPASISGTISYSGTKTGTIGIGLFTTSSFSGMPAYGTMIASPGSYSITNIAPGTYYIGASMDTNGDGIYDSALDPSGVYTSNPITLSNNQNAVGINITLTDSSGGATGDINGDGATNITDVILCLRQAIGLDTANPALADMNGDGAVNITDVILILRKAIGLNARMEVR